MCSGCGSDTISWTLASLLTNVTCVPWLMIRFFGLATPLVMVITGGTAGAVVVTVTSFDALLVPQPLTAFTRIKYLAAVSGRPADVAALPLSADETFDAPAVVPTSTRYEVGAPAGADQDKVTVVPDADAVNPPGADGAAHGAAAIVNDTSFETALVPQAFVDRRRAK